MFRSRRVALVFVVLAAWTAGGAAALDPRDEPPRTLPTLLTGTKWPGGNVPYTFDPVLTLAEREGVLDAFAELEAVCGVDFFPRAAHANYITVRRNPSATCSSNCSSSSLGMIGGQQFVNVGSSHWDERYVLVHELMHALGFQHEQKRPGCQHAVTGQITVLWANISQTLCGTMGGQSCDGNFTEVPAAGASLQGPYDFESIMHYGATSFSANGQPTIQVKPAYAAFANSIGNRTFMSFGDAGGLQAEYGAPAAPAISSLSQGFVVMGAGSVSLTITGTGFFEGSPNNQGVQGTRARWNGAPVAVTYLGPTQVQLAVTVSMINAAGPGCVSIAVENASFGGGVSNSLSFNIISLAPTVDVFHGTYEGEQLGHAVAGIRDVNGDGADDVCVGVPRVNSDDGRVICYSGATGAIIWLREGPNGADSRFGSALAQVGDIDGDGIHELLVGAPTYGVNQGRAYVLSGVDGTTVLTHTSVSDWMLGSAVAAAGDVNGDGAPDYVFGSPRANGLTGLARVHSGSGGGVLLTLNGTQAGESFGSAVGGGYDLDGDGLDDVVVGSPAYDGTNGTDCGRIRAFSGATGAILATRFGDGAYDDFGFSVALIPATGGGAPRGDIVAGAVESGDLFGNGIGAGYVRLFGPASSGAPTLATLTGDAVGDRFGGCVRSAGDLDRDGRGDFVVGAWQGGDLGGASGAGYVRVYGSDLQVVFEANGSQTGDRFGWAVDACGDTNEDGRGDVIAGAPLDDTTCLGAGEARILHPAVPPAPGRLLITEVTWGNPDGVELTNFSGATLPLAGWSLHWDDGLGGGVKVAPLAGSTLAPGETLLVSENASGFAEAFPGTQLLETFPALGTTTHDLTVTLVDPNGTVIDGVRVSDTAGNHALPGRGELFRGLALRGASHQSVERIWGLDSNGGADWTAETQRSMGLANRSSGPRGTDPVALPAVVIDEVDHSPDYVEIRNAGGVVQNLRHWYFLATYDGGAIQLIRPWPGSSLMSSNAIRVIGDGAAAPAELPPLGSYVNVSALGGGNFPFISNSWSLGLYDSYGRLVDLVRAQMTLGAAYRNAPRLPAPWEAFTGAAPQTALGEGVVARIPGLADSGRGSDWQAAQTRSMGSPNQAAHLIGPPGTGDRFEVRAGARPNPSGNVSVVLNADVALAGDVYYTLIGAGHLNGNGPFFGVGMDAFTNLQNFSALPPFSGLLDARASGRFDLPLALPPGIQLDLRFVLVDGATTTISAWTPVIAFDS